MSINGCNILVSATGITVSGGTAATFADDGQVVKNGIHVVDQTAAVPFIERKHATFKNRSYTRLPDGTFTRGKRNVNATQPILLPDGTLVYQPGRLELEIHPQATEAQILELRLFLCQLIMDADLDSFYKYGTTK